MKNTKQISFHGRTWASVCKAYNDLKSRYNTVKLSHQISMGAGLFKGYLEVA